MSTLLATRDRNERRRREIREKTGPSGGLAPALRLRAAFRCWALGRRWAGAAAAIASPNFVLSEHAFKRLGLGAGSDDEVEDGYGSDQEGPAVVEGDKDELAISRLGSPPSSSPPLRSAELPTYSPSRCVYIYLLNYVDTQFQVLVFEPLNFRCVYRDLLNCVDTQFQVLRLFTVGRRVVSDSVEFSWSCNPLCIHRRGRIPRALVLAPTRELAKQVENEIMESAPKLSIVCVYGGVSYNTQQNALPSCCYHLNTVQGDDCMEHFMG
ncbi:DEAD-box RNA helicase [Hordeum vulgare]|nr:DEAD-box RNA helicase [Hordeum vulgare]